MAKKTKMENCITTNSYQSLSGTNTAAKQVTREKHYKSERDKNKQTRSVFRKWYFRVAFYNFICRKYCELKRGVK